MDSFLPFGADDLIVFTGSVADLDGFSRVTWEDPTFSPNTFDEEEEISGELVESVGFLIHSDEEYVVLAMNRSGGEFSDYLTIPRSLVQRIDTLVFEER